jgi:hypothetical protein
MPFEFFRKKPELPSAPKLVVDIDIRFLRLENRSALRALDELEKSVTFPVEVDYSKTLDQLISEGNYGKVAHWVHNGTFPARNKGKHWIPVKLVRLTENARNNIEVLMGLGLMPIDAHTIISLGNQYPDLQKDNIIAAYGQTYGMDKDIVILTANSDRDNPRVVGHVPSWGGWAGEKCVFAVKPTWQSVVR